MPTMFPSIEEFLYILPALLIGLTLHEFAHALVAFKLGDPTAKNLGRLTLNPLKHLDPIGAIFLVFFHFGWAKPVPVNPFHFRGDRERGMLLVSLAGPGTNLLIALVTAFIWKIIGSQGITTDSIIWFIFDINIILAVFNFIPVPPLDGSKILAGILPRRYSHLIYNLERYGFLILLLLVFTGITGKILIPAVNFIEKLILTAVGI